MKAAGSGAESGELEPIAGPKGAKPERRKKGEGRGKRPKPGKGRRSRTMRFDPPKVPKMELVEGEGEAEASAPAEERAEAKALPPAVVEAPAEPEEGEGKGLTLHEMRVQQRRERVARMIARRMTTREMADALGVSQRTIEYDVAAIREEVAKNLTDRDALKVAVEVQNRSEARQRELWGLYAHLAKPDNEEGQSMAGIQARVTILRELRAETEKEVEMLQRLGIVYQAPREFMLGLKALHVLRKVPEAELERWAMLPPDAFMEEAKAMLGEEVVGELIAVTTIDDVDVDPEEG